MILFFFFLKLLGLNPGTLRFFPKATLPTGLTTRPRVHADVHVADTHDVIGTKHMSSEAKSPVWSHVLHGQLDQLPRTGLANTDPLQIVVHTCMSSMSSASSGNKI
eukprot:scpid76357/ scgid21729/ 